MARRLCQCVCATTIFGLFVASSSAGQTASVNEADMGVRHGHATWSSPESVVRDLNSHEDPVRGNALFLVGLDENQIKELVFDQNSNSTTAKVIGKRVLTIDALELRYAALGEDATQHAILSVQSGPMAYAAVAGPQGQGVGAYRLLLLLVQV